MELISFALNLQKKISKGKQPFFFMSLDKQIKILANFTEPANLIERSYFQYLCQRKQKSCILIFMQNLVSIIVAPFYYLKYTKKIRLNKTRKKNTAILVSVIKDISYVPESLKKEFDEIIIPENLGLGRIGLEEKKIIKEIYKRYWYNPYFCLKSMMKIALYSFQISHYNPKAILVMSEYSFTSSLLTYYCNEIGVEHINLMHGEKLFNIRDSFVKFNRYYVWDQHYSKLLSELKADIHQFFIEIPACLDLNLSRKKQKKYALTYYLGDEGEKDLYKIRNNLKKLDYIKEKICIRCHPRYSNLNQIKSIFNDFIIENPNDVSLKESLNETDYVISLYSTVLFQAYLNKKKIIIDNITNVEKFKQLEALKYIMLKKPHELLSDLLVD